MNSMTGFGRALEFEDGREISIEIKSVNSRFLDINFRMPKNVSFLEDCIRKELTNAVERGKFDVYLYYRNYREDRCTVTADLAMAKAYQKALEEVAAATGLPLNLSAAQIAGMQQVLSVTEQEDDQQALILLATRALGVAIASLKAMRQAEGESLKADLLIKMDAVEQLVKTIAGYAPEVAENGLNRLMEKMKEYYEVDESIRQRVLAEAALIADKHAIDEEIVRLNSHMAQFRAALEEEGAIGRRLDFIVQEMNREVNTIGSKANHKDILNAVIQAKSELEKLREQVQNVE